MTRLHIGIVLAPFAAALVLGVWGCGQAPEHLPTHWGPNGQPDQWGTPFQALLLPPLYLLVGAVVLLFVEKRPSSNQRNAPLLRLVAFGLGVLALLMTAGLVFHWNSNRTLLVGLGFLFALIGNSLGRAQPNAFVGLRTPWVYLSRRAWHASQRRSGFWLTVYGLFLLLSGLFMPLALLTPWIAPYGLIVGIVAMVLGLTLASYFDYKRDPDPTPVDFV